MNKNSDENGIYVCEEKCKVIFIFELNHRDIEAKRRHHFHSVYKILILMSMNAIELLALFVADNF